MAGVMEMSVSDWIAVPDNPRQRNTIRRANSAVRGHLSHYEKIHQVVFAATMNDVVRWKLDGHTRAYLWAEGLMDTPPDGKVLVILIPVRNVAEAKEVYDQLDCQNALKQPSDIIYGATREHKFQLSSPLLRSCTFTTQLKIAQTGRSFSGHPGTLVKAWRDELIQLDKLNLSSNYTIMIAVMLLSIRRDGIESAGPFWKLLDDNAGVKDKGKMDGPEALHQMIDLRRAEGRTAGYENLIQICSSAWDAYSSWTHGRMVRRLRRSIDFQSVVNEIHGGAKCQS